MALNARCLKECLPLDGGGVSGWGDGSRLSSAWRRWLSSLRLRFRYVVRESPRTVAVLCRAADRVDPYVDDESLLLAGDELRCRLRMACRSRKLILSFKLGLAVWDDVSVTTTSLGCSILRPSSTMFTNLG